MPGICRSQGKLSYIFCNELPSCQHSSILFWLQDKCLQLASNFIANNLRKKMGLRHFSISHIFSLIIGLHLGRHLGFIEMLNDARVASLGFFYGHCMHYENQQRKKV